jgi:hypothetical protein
LTVVNAILAKNGDAVVTTATFSWITLLNALANVGTWISDFRMEHSSFIPTIPTTGSPTTVIDTYSLNDAYAGLATVVSYKVKNIVVEIDPLYACDQATTYTVTITGIAPAVDKTYTINIAAGATTGRIDPDETLALASYKVVTVRGTADVAPVSPPQNVRVRMVTEYVAP